jgi:peptide/nickel transport system ATP-binding protein
VRDRPTPILEITDLNVSYRTRAGEVPAVVDLNLRVMPGESVGLVGESGCGKSTVAMAIMQYMGANGGINSGSIRFKGEELTTLPTRQLRRLRGCGLSMVYQEPGTALNPSMRVGRQLMEVPMAHEGIAAPAAYERALQILAAVNLPDPKRVMSAWPHQISGGQQQRVVIAMALLSKPSLLLLDEPTTALDVTVEAGIVKLIAGLGERFGTAQIYISHNLGLIMQTCDRVCVMYSGEVVEEGRVDEIFADPRHPYTRGLFDCIPLPGADKHAAPLTPIEGQPPLPQARPPGCNFGPRCAHFQPGRCDARSVPMERTGDGSPQHRVRCLRHDEIEHPARRSAERLPGEPAAPGACVLQVEHVRKYYEIRDRSLLALLGGRRRRYVKANEDLSFSARSGETLAIVGESGCGKSTFARVLMGLHTATGGRIVHDGNAIESTPVRARDTRQLRALQMVFQNPGDTLNPSHGIGAQIARVIRKFGIETNKQQVRARVLALLDMVKLPRDFYARRPRQLSGGQKQRIGIARAFAGNPSLVVADEPVSALDVSVAAAITELLMHMQREHGTTLLFISHDLGLVRYLCDSVVVMYLGRIIECGRTREVFAPPYHPYTEALLAAIPVADPGVRRREIVLQGELPSAMNPPTGCPFHTRCPRKLGSLCEREMPAMVHAGGEHHIACHIPLPELAAVAPVIEGVARAPDPGA